jgi:hypothetical protein
MTLKYRVIGWRYLPIQHNFAHDSREALEAMRIAGRADFLSGNPDKDENDLRRAGYSNAEIAAYQRGFNSEARLHGFD